MKGRYNDKIEASYLNGVLLVDKEEGISSYDVIRRIKPDFPRKYKIGHAGTLDPFASGLLLILIGRATKLSDKLMSSNKEYFFTMEFGYETDTQDPTGEIIKESLTDQPIDIMKIKKSVEEMTGEMMQEPPIYSAKKVKGVSAYKLARKGKKPDMKPRKVKIFDFEIVEYQWPSLKLRAVVSSGTYIRTLAVDLARNLDSCATTTKLRRTSVGEYYVKDAFPSNLIGKEVYNNFIINVDG